MLIKYRITAISNTIIKQRRERRLKEGYVNTNAKESVRDSTAHWSSSPMGQEGCFGCWGSTTTANPFGRVLSRDAAALPQDLQSDFGTAAFELWLNQLAPTAMTGEQGKKKKPPRKKPSNFLHLFWLPKLSSSQCLKQTGLQIQPNGAIPSKKCQVQENVFQTK